MVTERDQFYGALGIFAVSIPVALLFSGLSENIINYYSAETGIPITAESDRSNRNASEILQSAQGISIFVSGALLVNAIIELVDYVSVGERYHAP